MSPRLVGSVLALLAALGCKQDQPAARQTEPVSAPPASDGAPAGSTAAPRTRPPAKIDWLRSEEQARARAARDRRMLLIDFAAEWCAPCQEMDEKTFRDPDLASLLAQRYLALKIDVTEMTKEQEALLARYRVKQLPVILVLGPNGKELYRWTDFVAAGPMRDKLEQLRP